jgi:hypothetical protein
MSTTDRRRVWMEWHLTQAAAKFEAQILGQVIHTPRLRSVGAHVRAGDDEAWLRVVYDDPDWGYGTNYLNGNVSANDIHDLPKPIITRWAEWDDGGRTMRGELGTYIADAVVAPGMALEAELGPTEAWLSGLRGALDTLATVPLPENGLDADDINDGIQTFFGTDLDISMVPWTAAHCDLHWGNITAPNLYLLDWEIWGKAPAGYDAATLYCTSLLAPRTADLIQATLAHHLDTHAGRAATLAVATRFLRFADEGDCRSLAVPLRRHAERVAALL